MPTKLVHHHGRGKLKSNTGKTNAWTPRAPRASAGSDEAILFAGNILYDPGFEIFVGNAAGSFLKDRWVQHTGSTTFILPRFDISRPYGQRWPNGDDVSLFDIAQWAQYTEPYSLRDNEREGSHWQVIRREAPDLDLSTARGPNLGKWMARWYDWQSSGQDAFGNSVPGGLVIQSPGLPGGFSGRTEEGALIEWSFYCWKSEAGVGDEKLDLCLQFYKQDGTPIFVAVSTHTLTTTKTEFSLASNSPGGSYYIRACSSFRGTGTSGMMVMVDTGTLGVEK